MKKIRFIELFAGIGGFRYGLEKASKGFKCIWANEINKHACQIYRKNFGKRELQEGDIKKIKAKDIPDHDLLTAGFPCQTFSTQGKRLGFKDTRGTLFFDVARIIKAKRPKYILLENVKGLLSHDKGKTFKVIVSTLTELGYDIQWQMLNSKYFGVPQSRERVYIIGYFRGKGEQKILPL